MSKKKTEDLSDFFPEQEFFTADTAFLGTPEVPTSDFEAVPVDSLEIVWYKEKYKTSLIRNGNEYEIIRVGEPSTSPVSLIELLRELNLEEDLEALQIQLWVRGLALPEQLEKLPLGRFAELVEDVRKRNK